MSTKLEEILNEIEGMEDELNYIEEQANRLENYLQELYEQQKILSVE